MTGQTGTQIMNGVDVGKLKETIQAITKTPSLADFRFRIVNKWQGGGLNQTTVKASYGAGQEFSDRDGKFTMQADEPPILLSEDKAANPVEHLLHALAACVTTTWCTTRQRGEFLWMVLSPTWKASSTCTVSWAWTPTCARGSRT